MFFFKLSSVILRSISCHNICRHWKFPRLKVLVENCFLKTSAIERLFGKLNGNFYDFYLHWHLGRYLHKISEECPFCWNQIIRKQVLFYGGQPSKVLSGGKLSTLKKYARDLFLQSLTLDLCKNCDKTVQILYSVQC